MSTKQEEPIDVSRAAIVRLLKYGLKYHDEAVERSYAQVWWEGYIRACEQILEMERE
jgi:hypothetical protein